MTNLHLMLGDSTFNVDFAKQINNLFPYEANLFVLNKKQTDLKMEQNCVVNSSFFKPQFLNQHCKEYRYIVLHSLFFSDDEILALSDECAAKIIWCVWGHDLYSVHKKQQNSIKYYFHESVHAVKKVLRGTYIRQFIQKRNIAAKIGEFHLICIGYQYDQNMIRKKYGNKVNVKIAPYFSDFTMNDLKELRSKKEHLVKNPTKNILIGHSGFEFLEHEKYLNQLSKYKDEDIHINLVLAYGASAERINKLRKLAYSIFGQEKCTILTEMMPKDKYYDFLSTMDAAVFPYLHQSALANTKVMSYIGVKMYFNPRGVLYKGFSENNVPVYDCRKIGQISFNELFKYDQTVPTESPLYETFDYSKNQRIWKQILND